MYIDFHNDLESLADNGDELASLLTYARRLGLDRRDLSRLIARIVYHDRATTDRATADQARADARLLAQREAHANRLEIESMRLRARAISDDVSLIASGFMLHPETRILFSDANAAPARARARVFAAIVALGLWSIALHAIAVELRLL